MDREPVENGVFLLPTMQRKTGVIEYPSLVRRPLTPPVSVFILSELSKTRGKQNIPCRVSR